MAMYLYNADMDDFKKSLFRKCTEEEVECWDAVRFLMENGEPVFMLADGIIWQDDGSSLVSCMTMRGDIEYVLRYDNDIKTWTVINADRVKKPHVTVKHRSMLT